MMTRDEFHSEYKKQLSEKFNQTHPESEIDRRYEQFKRCSEFLGVDGDLDLSDASGEISVLFDPHWPKPTTSAPAP